MKFSFRLSDDSVMFSQGRWPFSSANIFYNIFFLKQKKWKKKSTCVYKQIYDILLHSIIILSAEKQQIRMFSKII